MYVCQFCGIIVFMRLYMYSIERLSYTLHLVFISMQGSLGISLLSTVLLVLFARG